MRFRDVKTLALESWSVAGLGVRAGRVICGILLVPSRWIASSTTSQGWGRLFLSPELPYQGR